MEHLRPPVRHPSSTFARPTSRAKIAPTCADAPENIRLAPCGDGVERWSVDTDPSEGVLVNARPRGLLVALLLVLALGCDARPAAAICAEECANGGGDVAGWQLPTNGNRPVCLCAARLDGGAP